MLAALNRRQCRLLFQESYRSASRNAFRCDAHPSAWCLGWGRVGRATCRATCTRSRARTSRSFAHLLVCSAASVSRSKVSLPISSIFDLITRLQPSCPPHITSVSSLPRELQIRVSSSAQPFLLFGHTARRVASIRLRSPVLDTGRPQHAALARDRRKELAACTSTIHKQTYTSSHYPPSSEHGLCSGRQAGQGALDWLRGLAGGIPEALRTTRGAGAQAGHGKRSGKHIPRTTIHTQPASA